MTAVEVTRPPNMDGIIAAQEQVVRDILPAPSAIKQGVLVPLKTTLELRDDQRCMNIIITRAPVKSANAVIT